MIHKTFSKQDLKDIIYDLNLTIPDYDSLNKHELIKKIILYFYNETEISFDNSLLFPNKDIEGDLKVNNIYEPKISLKMQRDLELKKQNKLMNKKVNTLIYKTGTFLIDFN